MQEDIFKRKRLPAIIDKKRTTLNYENQNNPELKNKFFKSLYQLGISENEITIMKNQALLEEQKYKKKEENLPLPPKKINNLKTIEPPKFHTKSSIMTNFDDREVIDAQFSLLNINSFISKFNDKEIKQLTFSEVFSFEPAEYNTAYKKIDEMKKTAKSIKEDQLGEFFRTKKRAIELEQEKIKVVHNHFDKIEDFIVFDDSMKFFFNADLLK